VISHEALDERLPNSEVEKIANDVLAAARLSLTSTLADEAGVRAGTAEEALVGLAKQFPAETRAAAKERARALVTADKRAKETVFGRFAAADVNVARENGFLRLIEDAPGIAIDLKRMGLTVPRIELPVDALRRNEAGGIEIDPARVPGIGDFEAAPPANLIGADRAVSRSRLEALWGHVYDSDPFAVTGPNEDFESMAATDKLRLWVRTVQCIDETNPEWWGDDEIALAGISIDEDGDTKPIGERGCGGGFDDGRSKALNWDFHMFSLRERTYWPKKYGITLVLAEKDYGGLASFVQKLWDQVRNAVHKALEGAAKAAGVALAAFLGLPAIGPIIGQVLAAAAKWIIDKLIGWLIDLFKDDIFNPVTAWVTVPSMSARWYFANGQWGSTWSPLLSASFSGFGGQYRLIYQWQLYS
jgi:hypothetical protein